MGVYGTFVGVADRIFGSRFSGQVFDLRKEDVNEEEEEEEAIVGEDDDPLSDEDHISESSESNIANEMENEEMENDNVDGLGIMGESDELINTRLRGTKLYYFLQKNKKRWV